MVSTTMPINALNDGTSPFFRGYDRRPALSCGVSSVRPSVPSITQDRTYHWTLPPTTDDLDLRSWFVGRLYVKRIPLYLLTRPLSLRVCTNYTHNRQIASMLAQMINQYRGHQARPATWFSILLCPSLF